MTNESAKQREDATEAAAEETLSPRKMVAIGLLLAGRPYADVAREVGIDAAQLYRWRNEAAFASELRSQSELLREAALFGLYSLAAESINALRTTLKSGNELARVRAAQTVLDSLGIRERSSIVSSATGQAADGDLDLVAAAREVLHRGLRIPPK